MNHDINNFPVQTKPNTTLMQLVRQTSNRNGYMGVFHFDTVCDASILTLMLANTGSRTITTFFRRFLLIFDFFLSFFTVATRIFLVSLLVVAFLLYVGLLLVVSRIPLHTNATETVFVPM